jgi:asparagine synthase (glutamine-hydrolysing)
MDELDLDGWAGRVASVLQDSVGRSLAGADEAAVAFSGGLDSSIVAILVSRRLERCTLYTVGLAGAKDLTASKAGAEVLGLRQRLVRLEVVEDEVLAAANSILALIPDCRQVEASFLIPSYLVFVHAREGTVFTGDGADELFGGYHRYLAMEPPRLAASLEADVRSLLSAGIERNRMLARSAGKELATPFLADDVVELALSIPPEHKVAGGQRKLVLRRAAELLGIPGDISNLPKAAAQYSSSVMKVLRKHPELFAIGKRV